MAPPSPGDLLEIPGVPPRLFEALLKSIGSRRFALVGGAVRDRLLHRVHQDPWRGLTDLDVVVELPADADIAPGWLIQALQREVGITVEAWREHGAFGTVELQLLVADQTAAPPARVLLDVAAARQECYPIPGRNPQVQLSSLEADLARRDFSINAMALLVHADGSLTLLDPHDGQADLAARRLRLLHPHSLSDDPTRLVRAARYGARLEMNLDAASQAQAAQTLAAWPWPWRQGDPPSQAPQALGTRLRMELELLLAHEPWSAALSLLRSWGGFTLLDPDLQSDSRWHQRLHWAQRFGLPLLPAFLAGAARPAELAARLQLPHLQQRWLGEWSSLRERLPPANCQPDWPASRWCALLESQGSSAEAVSLALASGIGPRRPLLRWWLQWRHVCAPLSAQEIMDREGLAPGPAVGHRLRQLRAERLDQLAPGQARR